MLRKILSISGRPGLFKLVAQGNKSLIVEEIGTGRRVPAFATEKVISLHDIAIYTDSDEVALGDVLESIKKKENGKETSVKPSKDGDAMRTYFGEVLPNFDRDRVHVSDIKKVLSWYNLLVSNGISEFTAEQNETEDNTKND